MNLPISIRGARQHNLRNVDLDLPSNKLIAFCGPSGSFHHIHHWTCIHNHTSVSCKFIDKMCIFSSLSHGFVKKTCIIIVYDLKCI